MAQSLMLEPEALNLKLRQYQVWNQAFTYCTTDAQGNPDTNAPIDLSGYSPLLQFRTSAMAKVASLTADVEHGNLVFDPTGSPQIILNVGINVPAGKYQWDLRLILDSDPTQSVFLGQGYVLVEAEVSR